MTGVDLGRWSVEELRAAGVDDVGVVQPLLRPRAEPLADAERVRRDLAGRGTLVLQGDRWVPRGDLGVLLVTRARARLLVAVHGQRSLLLGLFADGDGLLQVDEQDSWCTFRLRTRDAVADDLVAGLSDGPGLVLEALRADDPALPPVQVRLSVVPMPEGLRLVRGVPGEEPTVRGASPEQVRAAVRALLVGEPG